MVIRLITTIALLLFAQLSLADLIASVDRKEIGRSDAVSLQVRYSDMAGFSSPDWSILERDWDIINQDQRQQISFNNGQNSSYTEWSLTLVPRRDGTVLIPALEFKGSKSDPIRITVSKQASKAATNTDNFYFEVEVSSGTHYVQEQILYIERLYYKVNHDDANLSEFTVSGARMQQLAEPKKYITVVDGTRIGVYERRYALFPEEAGTLVIPGQRFSARVTGRYDRFRGNVETVVSKPIELDIKAIPASYPQAPWIPASRFTIEESFSQPPVQWQAGEPVTRTFTIKATGLSAGQVPPVPMPELDGLRYYPDQTQDSSQVTEQGIVTTVTQSVALVPTQEGTLVLPEVRIPWWNTLENRVEYLTLKQHEVTITAGSLPTNQPAAPTTDLSAPTPATETTESGAWPYIAGLLGLTNLLTICLVAWLFIERKKRPVIRVASSESETDDDKTAKAHDLWRDLKKAARDNNPVAIREGIITWAAAESGQAMTSLAQAEVWLNDYRLSAALAELDATLYSKEENSAFNGQGIIRLIENAQKQISNDKQSGKALPNLFIS